MAISVIYEAKELTDEGELVEKSRRFSTDDEEVENIVPEERKVGIHLKNESLIIPFVRVHELRIDLDKETVEDLEEEI